MSAEVPMTEQLLPGQRGQVPELAASRGRSGRPWRRVKAQVKAEEPLCWLCRELINPALRFPDPWAFEPDHIVPVVQGGHPTARSNLHASHSICNKRRGQGQPPPAAAVDHHSERW